MTDVENALMNAVNTLRYFTIMGITPVWKYDSNNVLYCEWDEMLIEWGKPDIQIINMFRFNGITKHGDDYVFVPFMFQKHYQEGREIANFLCDSETTRDVMGMDYGDVLFKFKV